MQIFNLSRNFHGKKGGYGCKWDQDVCSSLKQCQTCFLITKSNCTRCDIHQNILYNQGFMMFLLDSFRRQTKFHETQCSNSGVPNVFQGSGDVSDEREFYYVPLFLLLILVQLKH